MRRRDFITPLGAAAATWPLAARRRQKMPVVGFLDLGPAPDTVRVAEFQRGLGESGSPSTAMSKLSIALPIIERSPDRAFG